MHHHHQSSARRANPATMGTGVGLLAGLGVVGLGIYGFHRVMESRTAPLTPTPAPEPGEHELSGLYVPGATLGSSPVAKAGLRLPVALTTYSITEGDGARAPTLTDYPFVTRAEHLVIRSKDGQPIPLEYLVVNADGSHILQVDEVALLKAGVGYDVAEDVTYADGSTEGAHRQVLKLVTDVAGPVTDSAYSAAKALAEEDYWFAEPGSERDSYVVDELRQFAPHVDWPTSPEALQMSTPRWRTWMGIDLVGMVAYQNRWVAHPKHERR